MIFLVVDDSPVIRALIKRTIHVSGLAVEDVVEAGDGLEAIRVLATRPVDVLITDINMPNMNGEELVRAVRSDGVLARLPVIVVTTDASAARRTVMSTLGVTGYLAKPFRPEELRAQLVNVGAYEQVAAAGGAS